MVHGDDVTLTGKRVDLLITKSKMEESYELKMRAMLGTILEMTKKSLY